MTRIIQATAPGKLVLSGEYAVLDGAPALATSVGIRACARLSDLAGSTFELQILHTDQTYRFDCRDDGTISWRTSAGPDAGLLEAVIATLFERGLWQRPAEALLIQLDSREFFVSSATGQPTKRGLGSSAAVCVALTMALLHRAGAGPDDAIALAAHRRLQHDKGSGIDVACSCAGGTIEFFRAVSGVPAWRGVPWPDGLQLLPVWTGHAASTTNMLDKLRLFREARSADFEHALNDLMASSSYVVTQWDAGHAEVILAALEDFSQQLRVFDTVANLGIWSEVHQKLGRISAESGAVYKPSGAGAGDFGIAFATDTRQIMKLTQAFREQGMVVPEMSINVAGVEVREF